MTIAPFIPYLLGRLVVLYDGTQNLSTVFGQKTVPSAKNAKGTVLLFAVLAAGLVLEGRVGRIQAQPQEAFALGPVGGGVRAVH